MNMLEARHATKAFGSLVAVNDVSAQTKELDQKSFFAAGMAVFFLFFTVQFGVTSLLEERNDGTLARLLAAPISRASILGGKLAPITKPFLCHAQTASCVRRKIGFP